MNDLVVVLPCTCMRGTMEIYLGQLHGAGIDVRIETLDDFHPQGGTLGAKVASIRKYAEKYSDYKKMVISDAFDVTFYGTKEEALAKIPESGILQASEKNCYPDPSLRCRIPQPTPWAFANGGLAAGTPKSFLDWCVTAESYPHYNPAALDQWFMNECLANGYSLVKVDSQTELFFCLFGGYPELEWVGGKPMNTLTDSDPNFIHANGQWSAEEAFRKRDKSLEH